MLVTRQDNGQEPRYVYLQSITSPLQELEFEELTL